MTSDGFGCAAPPAGHCADSGRCSGGARAPASLLPGGLADGFTRRAVLGAAVAVPLLPLDGGGRVGVGVGPDGASQAQHSTSNLTPTLPSPNEGEGEWAAALAAYCEAKAAQDRFDLATRAATAGPRGRSFAEQKKMDDRFGDYLVATCRALRRLVRTPAPDLTALGVKIGLVVDERVAELSGGEGCMRVLKADARRLCRSTQAVLCTGCRGSLATALSQSHNAAMPKQPPTIATLAAAAILLTGLAIPAAAGAAPPWAVPEPDYGGARPLNPGSWYRFSDYPESAIRAGRQGYVTVAFEVLPSGRVGKCRVVRSSRWSELNSIPCRLLRKRARFEPARDSAGAPRTAEATTSMSFWMPAG